MGKSNWTEEYASEHGAAWDSFTTAGREAEASVGDIKPLEPWEGVCSACNLVRNRFYTQVLGECPHCGATADDEWEALYEQYRADVALREGVLA